MYENEDFSYIEEPNNNEENTNEVKWGKEARKQAKGDWNNKVSKKKKKKGTKGNEPPKPDLLDTNQGIILNDKYAKNDFNKYDDSMMDIQELNNVLTKKKKTLKERINQRTRKKYLKELKPEEPKNPFYGQVSKKLDPKLLEQALDSDDSDEELKRKVNLLEIKDGPSLKQEDFPSLGGDFDPVETAWERPGKQIKKKSWKHPNYDYNDYSEFNSEKSTQSLLFANSGVKNLWENPHMANDSDSIFIKKGKKKNKRNRKRNKKKN
jgi:hypothetical protein